jgi:hypothetical protein
MRPESIGSPGGTSAAPSRVSSEADALVEEAINLAEARSAVTCEICGESDRLYGPGWLTTRCAQHADAPASPSAKSRTTRDGSASGPRSSAPVRKSRRPIGWSSEPRRAPRFDPGITKALIGDRHREKKPDPPPDRE